MSDFEEKPYDGDHEQAEKVVEEEICTYWRSLGIEGETKNVVMSL
jgi:hypothetical protein